ncbi:hypothetical protein R3P38DRAFT_2800752 [Favolaschia claudopus]|uniref:ribonuclease H n=1 Tax=Favolaschia claudopus TaxID=2862362 RepID=A0AAV9ZX13_9AGAR
MLSLLKPGAPRRRSRFLASHHPPSVSSTLTCASSSKYALPVWYRPVVEREGLRRAGTVWVARALGKVQRQACKLITGALRTTATDVLDFHAHLLPVHIRLNRSAYKAAARLASLPSSNPVRLTFLRCRRVPRFHRSPLHHIIHAFPIFKSDFETIDPSRRIVPLPPGTISNHIAANKGEDMERVVARGGTCIFTDGSGFEDGSGAAAVAVTGRGKGIRRQKHLETLCEHTVFESEVCGAILALDIIADIPRLTDVDIFLDCQPAIIALASPKPQPGQYLLAAFHAILARLLRTRRTLKIRLRWVPAHVGIAGNELVDTLAKEAAQGTSTPLKSRIKLFESPLPTSRAAAIAAGAKAFAAYWIEEWKTSPRYARIASIDSPKPSNATSRLYKNLSRPQCSIITQLRTGHIGLNAYLFSTVWDSNSVHAAHTPSPNNAHDSANSSSFSTSYNSFSAVPSTGNKPHETGDWHIGTRRVLCSRCLQYVNHGFDPGTRPMDTHWTSRRCQELASTINTRFSCPQYNNIPEDRTRIECSGAYFQWTVGSLYTTYPFVIHDTTSRHKPRYTLLSADFVTSVIRVRSVKCRGYVSQPGCCPEFDDLDGAVDVVEKWSQQSFGEKSIDRLSHAQLASKLTQQLAAEQVKVVDPTALCSKVY